MTVKETVCKNKKMADSLLAAVELHTASKTGQAALRAVREYIEQTVFEIPTDSDERLKMIDKIERELALCATEEDRKRMIALYCGEGAAMMERGGLQLFVISREEAEALK